MSAFHLKLISKSASFYVISKNSIKNFKLKIQPLGLGFLNLPAYAQKDVLLLWPQGHTWYVFSHLVCSIHQNAILLCSASQLKITYKDFINMILYNSKNKHCMIHCCHECPGKDNLKNYLVENMLGLEKSDTEINFSM